MHKHTSDQSVIPKYQTPTAQNHDPDMSCFITDPALVEKKAALALELDSSSKYINVAV
jgi:hypothetical protein